MFNTRTDDHGEAVEEMCERGGELVATNEPAVITKTLLDAIAVEDGQGGARLANSASPDEGDWSQTFCQIKYCPDQLATSKVGPRWWGW